MKQAEAARALKIASEIMQEAGLCRYDDPLKCRRVYGDSAICSKCIESWLRAKARKELRKNESNNDPSTLGELNRGRS